MNYFKKSLLLGITTLMVVMLSGCEDLVVQNQNAPDRERALKTPGDIETLIQGSFRTFYYAGEGYEPPFALSVAADELSSSWGNFGMQDMGSEPRQPYNNDPSYTYSAVAEVPFSNSYTAISSALDGIAAIKDGIVIGDEAGTQRALAFAQFVIGVSHAHVAAIHDKGFTVGKVPSTTETFDPDNAPFEIKPREEVFQFGLSYLQSAIETAQNAPDFSIPSGWMGTGSYSKDEFIGIIKMYRAHYRAAQARTPQERRNVDWQAVLNDINEGYTEMNGGQTFMIEDTPNENWFSGNRYYGKVAGWTRADIRTIGPADTTGSFQNWLNSDLNNRTAFKIMTEDRRITGAEGPESAGKYFAFAGGAPYPASRGIYHYSKYQYYRNYATVAGYGTGNSKWIFTEATMRLLKAEALLHLDATANKQQVASLINESRVNVGGLPPADGTPVTGDPIGSMSDYQEPNRNDQDNHPATIWSMLKHEKRMEAFNTACGIAFFDKRGWGDLVEGTPEDLPIPGEELLILEKALYTSDVVGGTNKGNPTQK